MRPLRDARGRAQHSRDAASGADIDRIERLVFPTALFCNTSERKARYRTVSASLVMQIQGGPARSPADLPIRGSVLNNV